MDSASAFPFLILFGFAAFCFYMGIKTARADPQAYRALRRRAKSMRHVALGLVEPGENYAGGMAVKYTIEGRAIIVRTCQITETDLDQISS